MKPVPMTTVLYECFIWGKTGKAELCRLRQAATAGKEKSRGTLFRWVPPKTVGRVIKNKFLILFCLFISFLLNLLSIRKCPALIELQDESHLLLHREAKCLVWSLRASIGARHSMLINVSFLIGIGFSTLTFWVPGSCFPSSVACVLGQAGTGS